jgi:hypothetical protein
MTMNLFSFKESTPKQWRLFAPFIGPLKSDWESYVEYLEDLEEHGPGQEDPLFDWLARFAGREQLSWFARQELWRENCFADVARALKSDSCRTASLVAKLEQRGHAAAYDVLLGQLAAKRGLAEEDAQSCLESLESQSLASQLRSGPEQEFQALGALTLRELTASRHLRELGQACHRLGIKGVCFQDESSSPLRSEVFARTLARSPKSRRDFAEGAWASLRSGACCYEAYRKRLFSY